MADLDDNQTEVTVEGPSLTSRIFSGLGSVLVTTGLVMVFLFIFLARGRRLIEQALKFVSDEKDRQKWSNLIQQINKLIGTYLGTITIINFF